VNYPKLPALLLSLLLPIESSWSHVALAQTSPPSASALADVVKLKDGSIYRGTIVELVPGDHVDIVLPSGQTRRFPMSDVAYAGAATPHEDVPAAAASPPAPAPSAAGEHAPKAELHLEANERDVQFLVRVGQGEASGFGYVWGGGGFVSFVGHSRQYALICTAPCDGELPNGIHRLALSLRGGKAIEAEDPVELEGPATLRGTYECRAGTRAVGWVLFGLSLAAGTLIAATSVRTTYTCDVDGFCSTDKRIVGAQLGAGVGIMLAGGIAGAIVGVTKDKAIIEVVPQAPRAWLWPATGREGAWLAPASSAGSGLALRYRF
jgi:hypothetical protein